MWANLVGPGGRVVRLGSKHRSLKSHHRPVRSLEAMFAVMPMDDTAFAVAAVAFEADTVETDMVDVAVVVVVAVVVAAAFGRGWVVADVVVAVEELRIQNIVVPVVVIDLTGRQWLGPPVVPFSSVASAVDDPTVD